jgi:hypothetical protein
MVWWSNTIPNWITTLLTQSTNRPRQPRNPFAPLPLIFCDTHHVFNDFLKKPRTCFLELYCFRGAFLLGIFSPPIHLVFFSKRFLSGLACYFHHSHKLKLFQKKPNKGDFFSKKTEILEYFTNLTRKIRFANFTSTPSTSIRGAVKWIHHQ